MSSIKLKGRVVFFGTPSIINMADTNLKIVLGIAGEWSMPGTKRPQLGSTVAFLMIVVSGLDPAVLFLLAGTAVQIENWRGIVSSVVG